ncbi:MAG: LysM peptidoglycan-binding domain-containing protein, partial [Chloroflexota bacterium]
PAILGIGNAPQATASPGASPSGSAAAASAPVDEPTIAPAPSEQTYIVVAGDTMSKIANRYGVPLQVLIDANKAAIPNPDRLQVGQEVIIPVTAPTLVPNAEPTPTP